MKRLICLPLLLVLVFADRGLAEKGERNKPKPQFRTQKVERGSVVQTIKATGTLEPEEVIDVGAQVSGRIDRLGTDLHDSKKTIDYGTLVEAGTVLAQLDSALYQAQRDQARAGLREAEAKLKLEEAQLGVATRERDRMRKLIASRAVAQEEFDLAMATYEVARIRALVSKAALEKALAALKVAEINLDYTTIRSPVRGVIIDRRINVGQTVLARIDAPSLFLIARDLKRMQVWVSVAEADIARVRPGQRASFVVAPYPDQVFAGTVTQVRLNATRSPQGVIYTVVIATDNASGKLLPYLTADVTMIVDEHKDVLTVPNAALRWQPRPEYVAPEFREAFARSIGRERGDRKEEGRPTNVVWVEDKGYLRPIQVRLGLSDSKLTEIAVGDLKEGTSVVVGDAPARRGSNERKDSRTGTGVRSVIEPDTLIIQPGGPAGSGVTFGDRNFSLSAEDAEAIRRDCPAVAEAAPIVRTRPKLVVEQRSWVPLYCYGTTPAYLKARNWEKLAEGRAFTEEDVRARKKVCLVGQTIVEELFQGKSPVGGTFHIKGVEYRVVGLLRRAGPNAMGLDQDDIVLAPWTAIKDLDGTAARPAGQGQAGGDSSRAKPSTLDQLYPGTSPAELGDKLRLGRPTDVDSIVVRAASVDRVAEANQQITRLLRERHHIRKGQPDDFNIREGFGRILAAPRRGP